MSKKNGGLQGPQDPIREMAQQLFIAEFAKGSLRNMVPEHMANECFRFATVFYEFDPDEYARRLRAEAEREAKPNPEN